MVAAGLIDSNRQRVGHISDETTRRLLQVVAGICLESERSQKLSESQTNFQEESISYMRVAYILQILIFHPVHNDIQYMLSVFINKAVSTLWLSSMPNSSYQLTDSYNP